MGLTRFATLALGALGAVQASATPGACAALLAPRSPTAAVVSLRAPQSTLGPAFQANRRVHFTLRGGAAASTAAGSKSQPAGKASGAGLSPALVARVLLLAASPQALRLLLAVVDGGLGALTTTAALPEAWQAALAGVWALSQLAVAVPGRYDGLKNADGPPTARTANLFAPSGWAFAIWAPIFLGETLMMLRLTGAGLRGRDGAAMVVGRAVAPGWCAGTLAQVLWCATFRPSVCGPAWLWVPTLLLGGTALGLGVAHRALRSLSQNYALRSLPLDLNLCVRWPLALHLGWIAAAALVNLNNWLARRGSSVGLKQLAACGSVAAALGAAGYVWATTGDAVVGLVAAWALSAVAADGGQGATGVVDAAVLGRVRAVATGGAALAGAGLLAKIGA